MLGLDDSQKRERANESINNQFGQLRNDSKTCKECTYIKITNSFYQEAD